MRTVERGRVRVRIFRKGFIDMGERIVPYGKKKITKEKEGGVGGFFSEHFTEP